MKKLKHDSTWDNMFGARVDEDTQSDTVSLCLQPDSDSLFSIWHYVPHPSFSLGAFRAKSTHKNNHQNSPEWQYRKCCISRTWLLSAGLQHDLWTCEDLMNRAVFASCPIRAWWNNPESERCRPQHNFSLRLTFIFLLNQVQFIFKV